MNELYCLAVNSGLNTLYYSCWNVKQRIQSKQFLDEVHAVTPTAKFMRSDVCESRLSSVSEWATTSILCVSFLSGYCCRDWRKFRSSFSLLFSEFRSK